MFLKIENLTKVYRGGTKANEDVSLSVEAGEVFGLLGPNGAGKTTLVGQILGLVAPTSGSITIDGVDVIAQPSHARKVCSYQPQTSVPIDGLRPLEAIELAGRIRGGARTAVKARAEALVGELGLGEWADRKIPLSGGVARLVAFCMAVVVPGRLVILDEPTNDVDPLRRKLLWQQVRALADEGSAILLVTHNVLEAERCVDRLAIMDGGRALLSGSPASLKAEWPEALRLEILWEPAAVLPEIPPFLLRPSTSGRRMIADLPSAAVAEALAWSTALREKRVVEEFSIGPVTLEDVYVRQVSVNGSSGSEEVPA